MVPLTVSATQAKLKFGALMEKVKKGRQVIIENNKTTDPYDAVVMISLDDFEDFLEVHNPRIQKEIAESCQEIRNGKFGTLDDLYALHRKKLEQEAKKNLHF